MGGGEGILIRAKRSDLKKKNQAGGDVYSGPKSITKYFVKIHLK